MTKWQHLIESEDSRLRTVERQHAANPTFETIVRLIHLISDLRRATS